MPIDVEHEVRKLYETYPYPNWRDKLDPEAVRRRVHLLRSLHVPLEAFRDATVLDAGCGTGEKTVIMASFGPRLVIGMDVALAPLRNAKGWVQEHGIDHVAFVQGSVLDLGFLRPGSVDILHCAGVLHHTRDPAGGVRALARLLRPGGYLILYVYNPSGRAYIRLKRMLIRLLAGRDPQRQEYWAKRLFPMWQEPRRDATAVYHDFYCHPHESSHPLGEVLGWMEQNGLEFCGIYPPVSWRAFCRSWAQFGRPGFVKTFTSWIARRLPDTSATPRRPGPIRRFLVQSGALIYVLVRRTNFGWAVAGIKR